MVRALLCGMAGLGLRLPEVAEKFHQATVPLDLKRAVVQAAVEQAGLAVLPLLGRGLHDLAMEPTHLALTAGRSAASMLVRWQRLERYIHSKHRIQWLGAHADFGEGEPYTQRHGASAFGSRGFDCVRGAVCFAGGQRPPFGKSDRCRY